MGLGAGFQAVILAAGAGKRLRPLTLSRSKALAPLVGQPMLARVIETLGHCGLWRVIVVTSAPDDDVARWCAAYRGRSEIQVVVQPERLGMGHALACAAPRLEGPFVLHACDTLIEGTTLEMLLCRHLTLEARATLALEQLTSPEAIARSGIVGLDGERVLKIVEKPKPEEAPSDLCAIPVYVFEPQLLEYLAELEPSPRGELELQPAIQMLIDRDGAVYGHRIERRWQITTTDDLLAINRAWLDDGHTQRTGAAECVGPVWIGADVEFAAGCRVGPHTVIESGARVGAGAVIEDSVILADAQIPAGARIRGEVVAGLDS